MESKSNLTNYKITKKCRSTTFIYYATDMSVGILNEWYKTEENYKTGKNLPSDWEIKRHKMTKWNKKINKPTKSQQDNRLKVPNNHYLIIQRIGNIL